MHPFKISGKTYFLDQWTQDLQTQDLSHWLEHQSIYPKVFWREKDGQMTRAAVGNLLSFPHIPYFEAPIPHPIRFYGGARFAQEDPGKDLTWQGFPSTRFWLPQIEISQEGEKAQAVFHFLNEKAPLKIKNQFHPHVALPSPPSPSVFDRQETPPFATWEENVEKALDAIASRQIDKLVLARRTTLQFSQPIAIWRCLTQLMLKAKHATVFAFQLSPSLCFLGATPEKLFERREDSLSTDVLAATQPRGQTPEEDLQLERDLLNGAKERREFTIVKEFLEATVSPFAKKMGWDGQDRILKASHVQHIHNRLNATLKSGISNAELIHALHPTPALGGFPRKKALSLLKEIESFDRGWYGAPIGMIDPEGASLYVAIRSALIKGSSLHLFAGTGLVEGSIAKREWEELEQKIRPFTELFL